MLESLVIAVTIIGRAASLKVVALLVNALFGVGATSLILLAKPALAVYNTVVAPNTVVLAAAPVTVISIVFPLKLALAAEKFAPLVGKVQSPASKVEFDTSSL